MRPAALLAALLAAASLPAQVVPPAKPVPPARDNGAPLDPVWKYEADLDINGRSGDVNASGYAAGFRAEGEHANISRTTLSLRGKNASQEDAAGADVKSADELRGQAAYERTLAEKSFWYVRADAGYDNVRDLDLIALGSAGLGHRFLKDDKGSLDLRAGLGYRQEEGSGDVVDVSAAALDAGLNFERDLGWGQLRIQLDLVPSLEDLADLTLRNEASLELLGGKDRPLSLRIGLLQDYRSEAPAGEEKLQNTYFVRLVYRWQ
jgi:putative salt-induced outer membrane protein YdiY